YCSTVVFTPIFSIRRTSDGRVEIRPRRGLFPLPPDPIVGILKDHADRRERVANSVRGREVLPLAGVLAERNDQVEEAVHEARPFRGWLWIPSTSAKVRYACAASSRAPRPTPVSRALFTTRPYSKITAMASRVLKSSDIAASKSARAFDVAMFRE